MAIKLQLKFYDLATDPQKPKAGRQYFVVTPKYGEIECASYVSTDFDRADEVYNGFIQYQCSELEQDMMEIHGYDMDKIKTLPGVRLWAEIPRLKQETIKKYAPLQ